MGYCILQLLITDPASDIFQAHWDIKATAQYSSVHGYAACAMYRSM